MATKSIATCTGCARPLRPGDVRAGIRRCPACRLTQPGRPRTGMSRAKAQRCITCHELLLRIDETQGCTRCRACRAQAPGRQSWMAPFRFDTRGREPLVIAPKATVPAVSWWVGSSRDQFAADVARRWA